MKRVFISKEGCDVFPHFSIHTVIREDKDTYFTEGDRFPKPWATEFASPMVDMQEVFTKDRQNRDIIAFEYSPWPLFTKDNLNWNEFRRLGYYKDGDKTGNFTDKEYKKFEEYSRTMQLNINKYD